jgi:phosphoribosylformylglycinamidine synthase
VGRRQEVPSEAAVILPVLESPAGLAMAQVLLTEYGDIDAYHMVAASVDEAFRRVTAVGGDPMQAGGVDNFCWPSIQYHPRDNPDGRYKAAQLVRACWALKDACLQLGVPLLSGKDSMYVDGKLAGIRGISLRVSGPPTMMFTATAPVPSLHRAQTLEPKAPGDLVYVLGATANELGASALYNLLGYVGLNAPRTDCKATLAACAAVSRALELGLAASVCTPSRGGLAIAWARMALAAELGLDLDLDRLAAEDEMSSLQKLFSESTGRFVVTLDPSRAGEFESLLDGVVWSRVGTVSGRKRLTVSAGGAKILELGVGEIRRAFNRRFGSMV